MATYKCTMILEQRTNLSNTAQGYRIGGWSEGVYAQEAEFGVLQTNFLELCRRRANLLSLGGAVVGQRYQLIDPSGRTVSTARRYPGINLDGDVPQMALTFVLSALSSPNVRRFVLRGTPDSVVFEGEYRPNATYPGFITAFVNELPNFRFRANNLQLTPVPLSSIAGDGTFVLQLPLTYAVNDYFNVSRAKNSSDQSFSGRFHVETKVDSQHGKFSNWPHGVTIGGTVKLDQIIYPIISAAGPISPKAIVRKVGRPLGGYRGRASARA